MLNDTINITRKTPMKQLAIAVAIFAFGVLVSQLIPLNAPPPPVEVTPLATTKGPDGTYLNYLAKGKETLIGQSKFLAATIERQDSQIQHISKDLMLFSANTTVVIHYRAEYSFGYDFKPGTFDVIPTEAGIEVRVDKPKLLAAPGVKIQSHEIPNTSLFINGAANVARLYQGLPKVLFENGTMMASDEAIIALCEKRLINFLQEFLLKQPGVKSVPAIRVVYRPAAQTSSITPSKSASKSTH